MLSVKIKDILFKNPILTASGTFGYGNEIGEFIDIEKIGGVITKSVTLHPREGNPQPRIAETDSGMLNSIGLANLGVKEYCSSKLPYLNKLNTNFIINIAGYAIDDYVETLQTLESNRGKQVGYEINISCPNVKEGGMAFGVDPKVTEKLASEMKRIWRVDNQSIGPSEILDYTITDTANGHPRTEIISAIFLHDPKGIVGFEVSDTDNQSDKREIIIH